MAANLFAQTGTIGAGASLSAAIPFDGTSLVGVFVPATWTAAALSFLISDDGVTFAVAVDQNGAEISILVQPGKRTVAPPLTVHSATAIKLRSGTSSAPVNQASAAAVTLINRPYF